MRNELKIVGVVMLLLNSLNLFSQDVEFSQFYANKIYLNPAFAGSDFDPRISFGYRNQWPELNSAYISYSVAYDQYVNALGGGFGLQIMQDEQGDGTISTTTASGMYSYTLRVSRDFLIKTGFQVSFIQRKLDDTNFTYPDQTDEFYINGLINPFTGEGVIDHLSRNYFDFSTGMIASYKNWFVGFAAHHITEPNETFKDESDYSKLPRKYTLHCGVNVPVFRNGLHRADFSLAPNFLLQQQGTNRQLNYGLYLSKGSVIYGMWYRDNLELEYDAIILQLGIIRDWWQVSYSYDKTVSKLIHTNTGAHEISFLMRFKNKSSGSMEKNLRRRRQIGRIKCPKF
ncbi:PorP/SprF family type IX secretion system membrane protein [Labilibaculum sp.]|uniref:PorP/SprF family type IX secretion system membrane protein n=1 Tax=Labilibaculum sp. TaxID=2060723 RepID=UPI002AA84F7B|nr:PorP/SprF family type IX secretion system membrane protein [Labilibaculum sp.]MBN2596883.1 PorP/SprF family type IX secretion system membrane protein [Marinifilaceae bacterium]